jgi:tRNA (cmo5U34)-methyltransferase
LECEKQMTKHTSEWQTEQLSNAFLEGMREAIPGADLQFAVINKIARAWCPQPRTILDLGCGNGILGKFLLSGFPTARGLFIDFSEPMLAAARGNLSSVSGAAIIKADFSTPAWLDRASEHKPFDLVISGFAIHHQPDDRKRTLYGEILSLLSPGGVFLNLEHVASATASCEAIFDDFFVDHLHQFQKKGDPSSNRASVAYTYYERPDKKENILAPVDEQCGWLRELGFEDVDFFFKVFELALFGGRRSSNKAVESTSLRSAAHC